MNFVIPFAKISKKNVKEAGGKGASLGEMAAHGFPVPDGFVILASAFDKFLAESDLDIEIEARISNVNYKDVNSVDRASNEIRAVSAKKKMPEDLKKPILAAFKKLKSPYVAVRSSATAEDSKIASWAGELESYLFVNQPNLLAAVKKCWSSMFTPRAIFYRYEKKLHKQKVAVAVVIQKMIDSEVSGVAFTVHPVSKDKNQMVIEAVLGQGEAIVSGQVTPDTYVIDKKDNYLVDINVAEQNEKIIRKKKSGTVKIKIKGKKGHQQKLAGRQIVELAKICKLIEKHYHHPQDIEWALHKNKFYITQSRPITTL
ncbi:MAG: PEP/pyruvate-binding domain-containing protein [Patescibacteria group bacterium]